MHVPREWANWQTCAAVIYLTGLFFPTGHGGYSGEECDRPHSRAAAAGHCQSFLAASLSHLRLHQDGREFSTTRGSVVSVLSLHYCVEEVEHHKNLPPHIFPPTTSCVHLSLYFSLPLPVLSLLTLMSHSTSSLPHIITTTFLPPSLTPHPTGAAGVGRGGRREGKEGVAQPQ